MSICSFAQRMATGNQRPLKLDNKLPAQQRKSSGPRLDQMVQTSKVDYARRLLDVKQAVFAQKRAGRPDSLEPLDTKRSRLKEAKVPLKPTEARRELQVLVRLKAPARSAEALRRMRKRQRRNEQRSTRRSPGRRRRETNQSTA